MKTKRKSWTTALPLGVVAGVMLGGVALFSAFRPNAAGAADQIKAPAKLVAASQSVPASGAGAAATVAALQALDQRYQSQVQPVLVKYCYNCHGNGKHKGDIALDGFSGVAAFQADRTALTNFADVLHQGSMPPEEKPQPDKAEAALLGSFFRDVLEFRDPNAPRDPGRVTIRRLNRTEYNNTVRDLVGIDFKPASDFPADDTGYGFDNIADVLSMSPLLAEKYFSAAEQIMDNAIPVGGSSGPKVTRYTGAKLIDSGRSETLGSALLLRRGTLSTNHDIAMNGEYEIRVRAGEEALAPETSRVVLKVDEDVVKTFDVKATKEKPQTYAARTALKPGPHKLQVIFTNEMTKKLEGGKTQSRKVLVEWVELEGPLNAPAAAGPSEIQKKLLFVLPGKGVTDEVAAWQNIRKFATRAFRRPVTLEEMERLMKIYAFARKEGADLIKPASPNAVFEFGVKQTMTAVLVSPQFVYRFEPQASNDVKKVYAISDFALATRLSYFLWSSMPDDELYSLAEHGKLRSPGVLETQVKRMLHDPRSQALVTNFAGQWLELRNLDDYEPNKDRFPKFNPKLRDSMKREPELFFANLIKEDRSILELLDSDYTFVNARLAEHYGIAGVTSEDFKKVSLTGTHRGGVLTMAAVMTVTAMPYRTSPVKRGKFVLEQILGTPPPPPPPDVPPLDGKKAGGQNVSLRQRMEQHRTDPVCASCHRRMDPIGFALENFDAIGTWRDKDGSFTIDASGQLPGNVKVDGPDGLRKVLLDRKADFVRCLCEKLLTYGIGRGIEAADRIMVEEVAGEAAKANYSFSGVVLSIVQSDLFQKRRSEN